MFEAKRVPRPRLSQTYLSSFLRLQITSLQDALCDVERSQKDYNGYLDDSMRRLAWEVHRFRKGCCN